MMMNLMNAGSALRAAAQEVRDAANGSIDEAVAHCTAVEQKVRTALEDHDAQRRAISGAMTAVHPLYRLAGLSRPASAADAETVRLPTLALDQQVRPAKPALLPKLAAGAVAGMLIAGLPVYLSGVADLVTMGPAIVIGGVLGTMVGGMLQGRAALELARKQEAIAGEWRKRVEQHVARLERIRATAMQSMQLAAAMERRVEARRSELDDVARDTTNAAVLLKDVLNTALLNEEGAFLDDVIERLQGQRQSVARFAERVAAPV